MNIKTFTDFAPGRAILISLFAAILVGTALLALPIARTTWIDPIDLFFTTTSVTCVCGLFTVPLDQFTFFGHVVILALIQIGGLGFITMALFLISLFINLGMATTAMAGKVLDLESWTNIKQLLIFIITLTICLELLGTLSIFMVIRHDFPLGHALLLASAQSISSFCNTGILPLLNCYNYDYLTGGATSLLTSSWLMLFGGLGFITWRDLTQYAAALWNKKRYTLSLYSKIVLYWTASLLVISSVLFWILEHDGVLQHESWSSKLILTLFHNISFKSAGLLTFNAMELQIATLLLIMIASFIGSAPLSTGSGIKVTSFAVLVSTIRASLAGKASSDIRGRQIPIDQVFKAITVIALSMGWIILATFFLLITEQNPQFFAMLFEASSAFCNLGITLGVTPTLSTIGKIFIILTMIIGRIGPLVIVLALHRRSAAVPGIKYPEERMMIG